MEQVRIAVFDNMLTEDTGADDARTNPCTYKFEEQIIKTEIWTRGAEKQCGPMSSQGPSS